MPDFCGWDGLALAMIERAAKDLDSRRPRPVVEEAAIWLVTTGPWLLSLATDEDIELAEERLFQWVMTTQVRGKGQRVSQNGTGIDT